MRLRLLPLLVLALASVATPALAQDTPTVFIHGLKGDARTWRPAADRLHQRLSIEPTVAELLWHDTYESQAADLSRNVPPFALDPIAVGHSNGGIVARQWSRSRNLHGLVTVGSPNWGAPLVNNLLDVIGFNQRLSAISGLALSAAGAAGFEPVYFYVQAALLLSQQIGIETIKGLSLLGLQDRTPVVPEMTTWSPFIQALNSGGNQAREASAIRARVGLTYRARNYWMMGPARAVAPDRADALYADMWAAIYTTELAANYLGTMSSPTAIRIATALRNVSTTLRQVDSYWCGAVTYDPTCSTPSDGVVSQPYQVYAGAYNFFLDGPAHLQEAQQSDEPLYQAFTQHLGVRPRGTTPPPPPRPGSPNSLSPDESLLPGQHLSSANGQYQLELQHDGNLVLYRMSDGTAVWSTGTGAAPGQLVMQMDGNLVLYDAGGSAVWASGTVNYPGAVLEMQNDGNLVIYSYNYAPLWDSGTAQ